MKKGPSRSDGPFALADVEHLLIEGEENAERIDLREHPVLDGRLAAEVAGGAFAGSGLVEHHVERHVLELGEFLFKACPVGAFRQREGIGDVGDRSAKRVL